MKEHIEFSDRERFLLSYYRDPELSSVKRHLLHESIFALISIGFILKFVSSNETAFGFVGYGILLFRIASTAWQGAHYITDIRNIIAKYDAKLRELTERNEPTQ